MSLLGSRSFFPSDEKSRWFLSCHAVEFKAYGSDQGGRRPTAYFEFKTNKNWEYRRVSHLQNILTTTVKNDYIPRSFSSYMELLMQPQKLQSWFNGIFFNCNLFEETQYLIRRGMSIFGPEMAKEALSQGFARLDIVVEAQEVANLNYYDEPEPMKELEPESMEVVELEDSEDEDPDESEDDDPEESEDDEELGMIPATKSSIESLKKQKAIAKESKEVCTVCLNQFSVAAEVAQMPCTHIFHKDCIVSWLERSHVCPICRYEMPT